MPLPSSTPSASISGISWFVSSVATLLCSLARCLGELLIGLDLIGELVYLVLIEQIVDPDLAESFELKDDPHAGEIDSLPAREESDDANALDVRLTVETEVVATLWLEEALLLVDPQRSWMAARQLGGDADDVSGSSELVAARDASRR
jgi:hypothetical protein